MGSLPPETSGPNTAASSQVNNRANSAAAPNSRGTGGVFALNSATTAGSGTTGQAQQQSSISNLTGLQRIHNHHEMQQQH